MSEQGKFELSSKKAESLRKAGLHVEVYTDEVKRQFEKLDDREIEALVSIKSKLNSGLSERMRQIADTVGGFVW